MKISAILQLAAICFLSGFAEAKPGGKPLVTGALTEKQTSDERTFYSDRLKPGNVGYHEENIEQITYGSKTNHCDYSLYIENGDTRKLLPLNNGVFFDGEFQKNPWELNFVDFDSKTQFHVILIGFGHTTGKSIQVSSRCHNQDPVQCLDASTRYELRAKCHYSDAQYPKSDWHVIAAHRNIRGSRFGTNKRSGKKSALDKPVWDGRIYSDDYYFNQDHFAKIKGEFLNAALEDLTCQLRLRFHDWDANVTRANAAVTSPETAFTFKGGNFSSLDTTAFPAALSKVNHSNNDNQIISLRFNAYDSTKYAYFFDFIFEPRRDEDMSLRSIATTSFCFRDRPGKPREYCDSRFHYYSLEYRCPD